MSGRSADVCRSTGDKAHLEMAHLLCMSAGAVQALLAQKAAFSNAGSVSELNSWTQNGNPCSGWSGVTCDQSGNIISLCAPCLTDGHESVPCYLHGVSLQANISRHHPAHPSLDLACRVLSGLGLQGSLASQLSTLASLGTLCVL